MAYRTDAYSGGFSAPVFDSQSTFRSLMDAMARPGTIHTVAAVATPPGPMGPAAGAIALSLCDHDTPVYLSRTMLDTGVQAWLAFHSGALVTDERSEAAFAFFEVGAPLPPLSTFAIGTQDYPDRSTTVVYEVPALSGGGTLELRGPGIESSCEIQPSGLPAHFQQLWAETAALFPRGIDLILAAGTEILCIPRTTRLTRKEG